MDLSLVLIFIIIVLFQLHTLGKVGVPGAALPRTAETSSQTKQTLGEGGHRQDYRTTQAMTLQKKPQTILLPPLDRSGCFCFLCSSLKKRKLQRDQNEKVGHGGGAIQANFGTQMHVNAPSLLYILESRKGKKVEIRVKTFSCKSCI